MATMEDIAASIALPEEERKRLLLSNMLLGLGAGLLDSRGRNIFPAISTGLLGGMQMGQQAVSDARRARMDQFKARNEAMDYMAKEQAFNDQRDFVAAMKSYPQFAQQAASPVGMPSTQGGQQQSGTPVSSQAPAPTQPQSDPYHALLTQANYLDSKGLPLKAMEYRLMAEKYAPQYDKTETVMRDGKPVLMQTYKNRPPQEVQGFGPKPDYKEVSTGAEKFFYDPVTGAHGGSVAMQMTPGEVASNEIAKGNLKVAQGHLGLAANADRRAADAVNNPKPQWDSTTGQWVSPPTPSMQTGAAVTPQGYTPKPPEHTRRELDSLDAQLGVVRGARDAAKQTPSAFSMPRGAATLAGTTAETIAGRMDSEQERQARSYVYNIVSAAINERAGAAQSVQELARLRSFLPGEMDNSKQIQDKLTAFEQYLLDKRKAYATAGPAGTQRTVNFGSLPR